MEAVKRNDPIATIRYLAHGVSPNWVNTYSKERLTVLHEACQAGSVGCVCILLVNSANVNAVDVNNHTPLYYAKKNKHANL